MSHPDFVGLHHRDLTPEERRALGGELGTAHARERELGSWIADLGPPPSAMSAQDILASARQPEGEVVRLPMVAMVGSVLALAAGVALALFAGDGVVRDRGVEAGPGDVHLQAVVEGPLGTRAAAPGERVGADERVVFQVGTSAGGELRIEGGGQVVWPESGVWSVGAGEHVPGGAGPLAYRPDDGAGTVTYRAVLCAPGGHPCSVDEVTVTWEP